MIMSNIIETLLLRNLQEVFGEGEPERRSSAIEELYTEDCVVNLPVDQYHGHEALDRICGELRASHPSHVYTPHNAPIAVQDGGRVDWGGRRRRTSAWIVVGAIPVKRPAPSGQAMIRSPLLRRVQQGCRTRTFFATNPLVSVLTCVY
jgi:SnoaL-like domain